MGCNIMHKDVNICFSTVPFLEQVCKIRKGRVGGRMFRFVEKKRPLGKFFMVICMALVLAVSSSNIRVQAEGYNASLSTDRAGGICTYTVTGIDINVIKEMTLKVTYNDNNVTEPDNGGNSSTGAVTDNTGAGGAVGIKKQLVRIHQLIQTHQLVQMHQLVQIYQLVQMHQPAQIYQLVQIRQMVQAIIIAVQTIQTIK